MEHGHKVRVPSQIFVYQSTSPVIAHGPTIILLSWYASTMFGAAEAEVQYSHNLHTDTQLGITATSE